MSLEMQSLVKALEGQTAVMGKLVESNRQLITLMTEVVASMADDVASHPDDEPAFYMDGTPIAR